MALLLPTSKDELVLLPEWYEQNPDLDQSLEDLLTTTQARAARTPFGYIEVLDKATDKIISQPVEEVLCAIVQLLIDTRYTGKRTFRESLDIINQHASQVDGYEGDLKSVAALANIFKRFERKLKVERSDELEESMQGTILQRRQRNIQKVLEKREKAIKEGKKPYRYSRAQLLKQEKRRELSQVNAELKKLKEKERRLKAKSAKKARELSLKDDPTKYSMDEDGVNLTNTAEKPQVCEDHLQKSEVSSEFSDGPQAPDLILVENLLERYTNGLAEGLKEADLLDMYREIMENKGKFDSRRLVFLPTPRQYKFLSSSEDIVLYGGAAGGGKSYSMVIDPLRYVQYRAHNAVIIRKTMTDLNELIDTSRELYKIADPNAKYRENDHEWTFSSGAKIRFSFLSGRQDLERYQGKAFTYIGFDELSQQETAEYFNYVRTRLRRTDNRMYPYVRATANPGSQWVYDMFIAPAEPETPFIMKGTETAPHPTVMKFIPAKLEDNPHLDDDGMYRSTLLSQSDVIKRQLLDGDWLASADNMFPEFKIEEHVIEPFDVPRHWNRVAGLDYGYRDPSAGVWFAVDPSDGTLIVYDEFKQTGLTGREFALAVQEKEQYDLVPVDHPVDGSIFNRTGHTGPTIAESMFTVPNFRVRRADKNREAGWVQIHELLRVDPKTGQPKMKIFSTCRNLVRELMSVKVHPTKPGDIKDTRTQDGHWDLLDALRYGVMSRPRMQTWQDNLQHVKQKNRWEQIDSYFSV